MKTKMLRRGDEYTPPKYAQVLEVDEANNVILLEWHDDKQNFVLQKWFDLDDLVMQPLFKLPRKET